jgi:hypothetical protein
MRNGLSDHELFTLSAMREASFEVASPPRLSSVVK